MTSNQMNPSFLDRFLILMLLICCLISEQRGQAIDPATLPQVGYHPDGIAYWSSPIYANALYHGWGWLEHDDSQWGTGLSNWQNPQLDENGYPQYLDPGLYLRAIVYGLHVNDQTRPPSWPDRAQAVYGQVVLEWQGDADIRVERGTFVPEKSSGAATGSLVDGRRVYRFTAPAHLETIDIRAINPADPISDIKVWLPDPADPQNASLEDQLFHPYFLDRIQEADWGFVRCMNLLTTNANPQQDWSDRRLPTYAVMTGTLNPRAPNDGGAGNRETGFAFEHAVMLANATGKDLWITVPHLATEDFTTKLAQLIRYGSDGVNPYTEPQAEPVYPPLDSSLRVYVEYSNEIWSSGYSFPQGNWAQDQADALGISKPQFNARRFCEIWKIFQDVFGGNQRLVRVAAVFTAADWYTTPFLQEIASYAPTLSTDPDVIAVTTYFGNGIQDYAFQRAQQQAGTSDPWFLTTNTFDAGGGNMHPVSVSATDPYWTSPELEAQVNECFDEWTRRLLSGDAREGAGPDAVGIGGGFSQWLVDLANTAFPEPKPIIAYEGGPSIYTDNYNWGDPRDAGVTTFMEAVNRHSRMAEVYGIHLNMAKSRGLWSHVAFTDMGRWSRYGQWGHIEYPMQDPSTAVKYQFMLDWITLASQWRHIDTPVNNVPQFDTPHYLPVGVWNQPYSADIDVSGGDGALAVELVGSYLVDGLSFDPLDADPDTVRISGTPGGAGLSYVYLRLLDSDGDPAWRTYSIRAVGGPDTLVESSFEGTNPGQNLPWTQTYILADGLQYSGFMGGPGLNTEAVDDALGWSLNMPANEVDSTLELAITEGEYLSVTLTPAQGTTLDLAGHELRYTIRRISYHAPRRHALFTSLLPYEVGNEIDVSSYNNDFDDQNVVVTFPDNNLYRDITNSVELRIYGYSGQYGGHNTSLAAFRLDGELNAGAAVDSAMWRVY